MDFGIRNKRVLVAGASKGIGRACAKAFANEGGIITSIARTETLLRSLTEEIGGLETGHAYRAADLLQEESPRRVAQELLKRYGPFDIVIHAIGSSLVGSRNPISPREEWQRAWDFNCGIAIDMNAIFVPPMQEKKWGRIVHVSSSSAGTLRGAPLYVCAKVYLNAYSKVLGRELARDGIVVSAVMPGPVAFKGSYWDAFVKEKDPCVEDFLRHHQACNRFGTPEEIANFVVVMGSNLASFAQGALIPIDGGTM